MRSEYGVPVGSPTLNNYRPRNWSGAFLFAATVLCGATATKRDASPPTSPSCPTSFAGEGQRALDVQFREKLKIVGELQSLNLGREVNPVPNAPCLRLKSRFGHRPVGTFFFGDRLKIAAQHRSSGRCAGKQTHVVAGKTLNAYGKRVRRSQEDLTVTCLGGHSLGSKVTLTLMRRQGVLGASVAA